MIDHIWQWEAEHGEVPKVAPKDAHTTKHTSDGFYIPLGGFMAEWGRARDEDTFHVMADCNGGQVPKTGQGGACTTWLGGEDDPFQKHLRDDAVTVIDLWALCPRYFDWDFLPDKLRKALVSIDAYIAIPDVQHSRPLNPIPRGQ